MSKYTEIKTAPYKLAKQWIATGVVPDGTEDIAVDASFDNVALDWQPFFHAGTRSDRLSLSFTSSSILWLVAGSGGGNAKLPQSYAGGRHTVRAYNGIRAIAADGVDVYANPYEPPYLETPRPYLLFAIAEDTANPTKIVGTNLYFTIHSVSIRQGGALVRDYVPVKSGANIYGTPAPADGLYDKVGQKLYPFNSTETITIKQPSLMAKFLDKVGLARVWAATKKQTNDAIAALNVGKAGGVATLGTDGKLQAGQMPSLKTINGQSVSGTGNIDIALELFEIVSELPTENVNGNKIYLVPNAKAPEGSGNVYSEYVYTGDTAAAIDAAKWEKLGEFSTSVDLSGYLKKSELATQSADGAMSKSDKKNLDRIIGDTYPFDISGFSVSPSLIAVGSELNAALSWGYRNLDFHPLSAQTVNDEAVDKALTKTTIAKGAQTEHTTVTFTLKATATDGAQKTRTASVAVNHNSYIGVAAANAATLDAAAIKAGTKSLESGKGKSAQIAQTAQKAWYAYPKYFGDLSSIKNSSGFEGITGYNKIVVQVDGTDYNLYLQKDAATATDTYRFA